MPLATLLDLPTGPTPEPVPLPHFPSRLHAFVWRNWQLVPAQQMAKVVGAKADQIVRLGRSMGLAGPPKITRDQQRRSFISVIKRNWHILPYEQLLTLLGWTAEQLAFTLREDDFLYVKLGSLKPTCEPIHWLEPTPEQATRAKQIAEIVNKHFGDRAGLTKEPLFDFVRQLSSPFKPSNEATNHEPRTTPLPPRFCYSYFALYGDALLDPSLDPYPDGYLARLADCGVNGVWLQSVLYKMTPFPWDSAISENYAKRLDGLRKLVARAKKHGIGIYLYFNEPRTMPLKFFEKHPELKGIVQGDYATLCTSNPEVQKYIRDWTAMLCTAVPDLAGLFTITASENLTNCWSHHTGKQCPRCGPRGGAEVIAEVNTLVAEGIRKSGAKTKLIAWDWGWPDDIAPDIIAKLPPEAILQSVSEWNLPIERGGVKTVVGEYSVSAIGPGPRATKHWKLARERGLKVQAKIQAANSWEMSAVPYIPALSNVRTHGTRLRQAGVDSLMLGWTLGGYPSPNLRVMAQSMREEAGQDPLISYARERYGDDAASELVKVWKDMSSSFQEFPYNIGVVYQGPQQSGPANLLWQKPTGYGATMVGLPYDDLNGWRSVYPPEIFATQFRLVSEGFENGATALRRIAKNAKHSEELFEQARMAEVIALHYQSAGNQADFVRIRNAIPKMAEVDRKSAREDIRRVLASELDMAKRLHAIQTVDSRIGFEASNQYYYVPVDLIEKVINVEDLLARWAPNL
jgi:hypothetical protein